MSFKPMIKHKFHRFNVIFRFTPICYNCICFGEDAIDKVRQKVVFICYKTIAHRYHDCHIAKVYKNDQTAKLFWNIIYFVARKSGF